MPAPAKYTEVMSVIKRRIREGDYLRQQHPRRATNRRGNGRQLYDGPPGRVGAARREGAHPPRSGSLDVHPEYTKRANPAEVVLLYPAYPSTYLTQLRVLVVRRCAAKRGLALATGAVRPLGRTVRRRRRRAGQGHARHSLRPRDSRRDCSSHFAENKVVILDGDFTSDGLPSIRLFSDDCIERVLDHLCGTRPSPHRLHQHAESQSRNRSPHRHLGALAMQRGMSQATLRRSRAGLHRSDDRRLSTDVAPPRRAEIEGHGVHRHDLPGGDRRDPRLLGAQVASRQGPLDRAVNIEPPAEFFCPSITGLNTPDLSDVLGKCFDWFAGAKPWRGPRLLEPASRRCLPANRRPRRRGVEAKRSLADSLRQCYLGRAARPARRTALSRTDAVTSSYAQPAR